MLGLLDKVYVKREDKKHYSGNLVYPSPLVLEDNSRESWYCFVPSAVMKNDFIRKRIIPPSGKRTIYTTHYRDMIVPDVQRTLKNLETIYEDAFSRAMEDWYLGMKISLLGASLGNTLSAKIAGNLPEKKVSNLISLVGGGRLGLSAWNSIATSKIAQSSGCENVWEYENVLSDFAPSKNLKGVSADFTFGRMGERDLMINFYPDGEELFSSLVLVDSPIRDVGVYPLADHCSTLFFASMEGIYDKIKNAA